MVIPEAIIDISMTPGSTFTINASVQDITDLYVWQTKIEFNTAVLECLSAWYPSDHVFAGKSMVPVTPTINNVEGYVIHGASLMGAATPFSGNGTLCQMEFNVTGIGFSGLDFSEPYGSNTFLLDDFLSDITVSIIDGYFENQPPAPEPPVALFDYSPKPPLVDQWVTFNASESHDLDGTIISYYWTFGDGNVSSGETANNKYTSPGTFQVNLTVTDTDGLNDTETKEITVYEVQPAKMYIDPPEIVDPTLLPPSIVSVNVTVDDVIDMFDYEFRLSYNTEMLTCIGAIINRVQGQTTFTPTILISDGEGYLWVNVTYYPPSTPITSMTPLHIVTVYFQIDTLGSSVLHLSDTELSDSSRQSMPHETEDGFIMTLIRDVAITHVAPSTNWAYQGWPVDITVIAKNFGNISETFSVKAYYDSTLIGTLPVTDLGPNSQTTLIFNWNTSGVPEGNYTISAEATPVPFEHNTTNNFLIDDIVRIFTALRDIAIIDVTPSRSWVFANVPVNINVTAKNIGETTETFNVSVYYDANLIGTQTILDLTPTTEITLTFTWNTTGLPLCTNYTISAEATEIPFEYNITNNILVDGIVEIRLLGDLTGDGIVDMRDVAIAAKAFGSYPGHPRWNPEADITGTEYLVPDNRVDMRDVALITSNFGNTC
jgi:PKD repeat protein